jgi:pimeloyl-ACP methyl ester carboxylesterase
MSFFFSSKLISPVFRLPIRHFFLVSLLATCALLPARAQLLNFLQPADPSYLNAEPLSITLEGWSYPYPVTMLQLALEGQTVRMAYMDVRPKNPNGQTLLLLHDQYHSSDYWAQTLRTLSDYGYRLVVPDQVGFGRSSKPEMQYRFGLQAQATLRLLDHLQVPQVAVIGHGMGGMLAVHFARRYSERVSALVLENPMGLEDYATLPPVSTEPMARQNMLLTPANYRRELKAQFATWRPPYERYVEQFARLQLSSEYPRHAQVAARTQQMILEGPILNEMPRLLAPTLLIIGLKDRTVPGQRYYPADVIKGFGDFSRLGKDAQARIPGAQLRELPEVGHTPHLEDPDYFHALLTDFLYSKKP